MQLPQIGNHIQFTSYAIQRGLDVFALELHLSERFEYPERIEIQGEFTLNGTEL